MSEKQGSQFGYTAGLLILEALRKEFAIPQDSEPVVLNQVFNGDDIFTSRLADGTGVTEDLDSLPVSPEGLFLDRVVYICDFPSFTQDAENLPKWHPFKCRVLKGKIADGTAYKYGGKEGVDPTFIFKHSSSGTDFSGQPRACIPCLYELSRIKNRWRDKYGYSLKDYYQEFGSMVTSHPGFVKRNEFKLASDKTFVHNTYLPGFSQRSIEHRKKDNRCAHCRITFHSLSDTHWHHHNRRKYDESPGNLKVLCILCHCIEHESDNSRMLNLYVAKGVMREFLRRNYIKVQDYLRYIEKKPTYKELLKAMDGVMDLGR